MKTNQLMIRVLMLFLSISLWGSGAFAQTNPTPFDMSTGASYSLNAWDSLSPANTYPANMAFWVTATQDPNLSSPVTGNYTAAYDGTSGTRMNGRGTAGANGFSFTNTSSGGVEGAAVLAINTSNRINVTVGWKGIMLGGGGRAPANIVFNGSNQGRFTRIRLQYRVGNSVAFTDVPGPVEFNSDSSLANTYKLVFSNQTFSTVLPAACNGQPLVQLRWFFYQFAANSGGTRPTLGMDQISVTSSPAPVAPPTTFSISNLNSGNYIFANTTFTADVNSIDGSNVLSNVSSNTNFTLSLATGTGILSGTLTGTILAGQHTTTVSGILYDSFDPNVSITATRTSGDNLTPGTSQVFLVLPQLTNPTPFNLGAGNYLMSSFDSLTPAGSYPPNMAFERAGPSILDPNLAEQEYQDYTSIYNATSQTRINGLGSAGFALINTSTTGNLGAAILALNCTGRSSVQVSWVSSLYNPLVYNASTQNRFYSLRAQYRVGISGDFTDVPGPVEFASNASATSYKTQFALENLNFILPAVCNNQPVVQVRWKYYSVSGTSGQRPQISMDEIQVISDPPFLPTNLIISQINGGASVTAGSPFTATVQSVTSLNYTANVVANTNFSLSVATGTGTLSGTITGTLNAGQNTTTVTGILYSTAETGVSITATRTSGDVLSPGTSDLFDVLPPATQTAFFNVPAQGSAQQTLSTFTVRALRADNSLDPNYSGNATIAISTGPGTISGTLTKPYVGGIATFNDIQLSLTGTYTLSATTAGLSSSVSSAIVVAGITEVIFPKFIEGVAGTNSTRVPFATRLTLTGLLPFGDYYYYNNIVISSDPVTTSGAGNVIFADAQGAFARTSSPSFTGFPNDHGEFFTDANGSYTGWFITEPTGNATRFIQGDSLYMRVILNDGNGGTSVDRRLTTSMYAIVEPFGSSATSGSSIYGNSLAPGSNFVFLYDNTSGSGRPLAGTWIEDEGTDNSTAASYATFYANNVNTVPGAWGILVPNANPNGVRRIEQRDWATGAIVGCPAIDADGVWPGGANTVNPTNGVSSTLHILATDAPLATPIATASNDGPVCATGTLNLTSSGGNSYSWSGPNGFTSTQQNPSISNISMAGSGTYTVTVSSSSGTDAGCSSTATTTASVNACAGPVNLSISSVINLGVTPSANEAFSIVVRSVNSSNVPVNVASNTNFTLSVNTGTGTLSGTITGTILAGTNSVTVTGILYNVAETNVRLTATRTSGDVLGTGTSVPFTVLGPATQLVFVGVPATGSPNVNFSTFTVQARRADNSRDSNYTNPIIVSINSGPGTLSGTVNQTPSFGVSTYSNLQVNTPGNYILAANSSPLPQALSTTIVVPGLVEVFLPQYMEGGNGSSNSNRLPYAFRVQLVGLTPNATYRYFNQMVDSSDAATSNGAGNVIFANSIGGFTRSTGPSVNSAGNFGTFTTDGSGSYTGWFVSEPTGNGRFISGHHIFQRIMLNDGASGTTVVQRLTTTNTAIVRTLSTSATEGTGIRGNSSAIGSNFVMIYDNVSGTGRPISGTYVESEGVANTTGNSFASFYASNVEGVTGAWGTYIPNALATGIRRIEQRAFSDGSLVGCPATDADGVWPSGANTVNPTGGTTAIVITSGDAPLSNPTVTASSNSPVCATNTLNLSATGATSYSWTGPNGFTSSSQNPSITNISMAGSGTYTVTGTTGSCSVNATTSVSVVACANAINLRIASVNGGLSASMNEPFNIVVQAINSTLVPTNVVANTNFSISINTGTGTLSGTLTGTILAGTNSVTVTGLLYNVAETNVRLNAVRTSGDMLGSAVSAPFTVLGPATQLVFVSVPATGAMNTNLSTFTLQARRADNSVDSNWTNTMNLAVNTGPGSLTGSVSQTPTFGVTTYSNIQVTVPGNYTLSGSSSGLSTVISTTINVPGLLEIIIPQFIGGNNNGGNNRLPYAYRVQLGGLLANATYRYYNEMFISTDNPLTNSGAGNAIYAAGPGAFVRTSSIGLSTAGSYGQFTTDATGSYTGWFISEVTSNARFTAGNTVWQKIILNNGAGGSSQAFIFTTPTGAIVRNMATTAADASGIYGSSNAVPSNFVMLYDNVSGTGRPLSGTFVESDGTTEPAANYVDFYDNNVDAQAGRWGSLIPNGNSLGVRRIEQRSLSTGAIVGCPATDADGVWPSGANTVNTTSGTTAVVITNTDASLNTPAATASNNGPVCAGNTLQLTGGTGTSYSWAGPNSFSSSLQNPSISNVTTAATGTYTLTVSNGTESGCSATATTSATVNSAPTISCPANTTVNAAGGQCGATVSYSAAAVTGSPAPVVTYSQASGSFFAVGTTTVTATATNSCGTVSCSFTVTVVDNQAPVISGVGANATIECPATPVFSNPTASDNCSATLTFSDVTTNGCGSTYSTTRTWIAIDPSGNTVTASQTISVEDHTGPVISEVGPNMDIDCPNAPVFSAPTAADACGSATLTFADVTVQNCGATYSTTRTWTATDACGNVSTASQTIHVVDTVAPVISGFCFDQTLECPDSPVFCTLSATDNCSTYTLNFVDASTPTCGGSYIATRTWTATDACGNVSTQVQTITVEDLTAPVITGVGPTMVILCPDTPVFSTPVATDECASADLTYFDDIMTFCSGSYIVTRYWTATDGCGNTSSDFQQIIVLDFAAPVISGVDADASIECPQTPVWSNPTAVDGCSNAYLTYDDQTTTFCGGTYTTTRTWTATDDCNNQSQASQTITVTDNTAPVITGVNASSTIECPGAPVFSTPAATDACSSSSLNFTDVTTAGCGGSYSTTRTWTATDECGNVSTASETITVEDVTAPVITGVGADQTIECPQAPVFSTPSQSDECSASGMSFTDVTTNGCGGSYTTTRTWTATDACGNHSSASQSIHVEDHTGPVISGVGANQVLECPATITFSTPTQSDACSASNMTFATVTTPGCGTTYSQTRTWTATDACGNVTTASQTISIQDHTAPVISGVLPTQTINCPATPNFCTPVATDACNSVVVTYNDVNVAACGGTYSRTRTWTAVDACGNVTTASQTINVVDHTAPVISGISPALITIQCPATPVFGSAIATDGCSGAGMTLTFSDATTTLCGGAYSRVRTWTATDGCGNVSHGSQTVNVIDNTAPVITSVQANATIQCPATPVWTAPTATDACGTATIGSSDATTTICGGSYIRTRTWTATDGCGNHSSVSRTTTVQDLTAPVIAGVGANATINCPATPVFSNPVATDACSSVTLAFNDVTTTICGGSYSKTRTWTATDACGNHSSASQTITVQDITAPVITGVGSASTIQCPASPAFSSPTATDGCGTATLTFNDVTTNGCGGSYTRTRTWTATDGCGNHSSASQTITVVDNTAPVITGVGANTTIDCPASPAFSSPVSTDACGSSTLTFADVTTTGICPGNYVTTRTWTATDGCGNHSSASQTITVHDVTAPVITCPATIYLCASDLSPALTNATATDGCSSVAISHTACPSNFPTGTTPITWTATDLCGNTASCVQNVVRNSAITVSIAASGAISGYCQGSNAVTLTATGAGGTGTLSYLWSTGATSQSIFVNVTGSYTCTVTDQFGHPCSASATYVFQTNSSSDLSSYTIIGRDKVHLHGYNVVQNGGIGATTVTGSASSGHQGWVKVHDHSSMNALTTFARAASIEVDGTSLVMNQILSAANPTLPAFDNGLPPNTTNVNVPAFTTVTLNATTYGDITVGAGATLIFGHATVDLKNLYVAHDATVQFAQACTRLRMSSQLDLDRNVVFNPDADGKDVAVYLKHINNEGSGHGSANYSFGYGSGGGALTSVNVEYGASVKAFIYAPNGKIDVHGGASGSTATNGNTSSAFSSTATTTMKGLFIARSVKAHGRTNWNWNTVCSSCNYALRETEGDAASSLKSEELTSGLLIENFPDPFQDKTTIRFVMDKDTHATVNVYDLNGKFITTVFSGDVSAKKEYKLEFDGSGLSNGMYIYKVITADDVHTGKMLMVK